MELQYNITYFIIGLIAFYLIGFFTKQFLNKKKWWANEGVETVEGSLLAMFAFFLGFTFSISASKVESVRRSSTVEANTIGTALLRTRMYPDSIHSHYQDLFKNYLKSRIDYFNVAKNDQKAEKYLALSEQEGEAIWDYTISLQKSKKYVEESRLMLPALNDMIDAVTTRNAEIVAILPPTVTNTLFILSFLSSFIVGFSVRKALFSVIGMLYVLIIALTVDLILDASNPRTGNINTQKANEAIVEIYESLQ